MKDHIEDDVLRHALGQAVPPMADEPGTERADADCGGDRDTHYTDWIVRANVDQDFMGRLLARTIDTMLLLSASVLVLSVMVFWQRRGSKG
jgi:hypothetical protein